MQKLFCYLKRKPIIYGWLLLGIIGSLLLVACGDATTVVPATSTATRPSELTTVTAVPPTPVATLPPDPTAATPAATPVPTIANVTPPTQPTSGPGGSDYTYGSVTANNYGTGEEGYYLYEPAQPAPPKSLPLVVLLHGYGGVDPTEYRPWINHIVRRGNIVIFPIYQQRASRDGEKYSENALAAIEAALTRLQDGTHIKPDLTAFTITGYSAGGVIATNLAARAEKLKLPIPKALFAVTPGGCANCSRLAVNNFTLAGANELAEIRPETKLLVLVGDRDNIVGETASTIIWQSTSQVPTANKNYLMALTDTHGRPTLIADHGMATRNPPNAMNYYGIWKLFDGLQSCALANKDCEYALGNTPQQTNLGKWSDGTPVTPLKVLN